MQFNFELLSVTIAQRSIADKYRLCDTGLDTGAPFDEHRRPLAPSKFFDVRVTEKNSIIAVAPCLRPWS